MSEEVLSELQLLTSMYNATDVTFHDPEVLNMVENLIPIQDSVSLTIRLNEFLELDVRLPLGYPDRERLSVHCRVSRSNSQSSNRTGLQQWEYQINQNINKNYIMREAKLDDKRNHNHTENEEGIDATPNILGVIQYCTDYFNSNPIPIGTGTDSSQSDFEREGDHSTGPTESTSCRIWIFSHHIYNKNKRKFLVNTAEELDLSGFSLPGKPGFVCVEGDPSNCDEYWSRVRQLTWQKISLIERQTFPSTQNIFEGKRFEELHCDKSAFIKFLEEKNSSEVIKDYLGF